jgi:hypothetical protein
MDVDQIEDVIVQSEDHDEKIFSPKPSPKKESVPLKPVGHQESSVFVTPAPPH